MLFELTHICSIVRLLHLVESTNIFLKLATQYINIYLQKYNSTL